MGIHVYINIIHATRKSFLLHTAPQNHSPPVEYTPAEEGDYDIAIKFGDEDVPGSPFRVPVATRDGKPKPNANKVHAYGPGLEPGSVFPGKPTSFTVDSSDTGAAPVEVEITNGQGQKVGKKPSVSEKGDGLHGVTYVPPLVGEPYEVYCIPEM